MEGGGGGRRWREEVEGGGGGRRWREGSDHYRVAFITMQHCTL